MVIATVTLDCHAADGGQADVDGLQAVVMAALDRHFGGYASAAEGQAEYRRVKAAIDAGTNLFGWAEALRAGLAAHPEARAWAEFERDATAGIEPFCFSIRFRTLE